MEEILKELREIKELLRIIVSNTEQKTRSIVITKSDSDDLVVEDR